MYILTRKNRVIDYCENGYLYVGTTVVCPDKGKSFQDATIVYTTLELPTDIDCKAYEYINGEFVRCFDERSCYMSQVVKILRYDGWSADKSIEVEVEGVSDNNVVIVAPDPSQQIRYTESGILCIGQDTDKLIFSCQGIPTEDIVISIVILDNK